MSASQNSVYSISQSLVVEDIEATMDFYLALGFRKIACVGFGAWVLAPGGDSRGGTHAATPGG